MRRKLLRSGKKTSTGKLMAGILLGGIVAVTVRWLTSPALGEEGRRSFDGKIKTSEENIESQARELVTDLRNQ